MRLYYYSRDLLYCYFVILLLLLLSFTGVGLEGVERSSPVELAAERLVSALQAYPVLPPPPDPHKANIIRLWIQQVNHINMTFI